MSGSPRGAKASCAIYSIFQTAKQNGMNPYAYLYLVFTRVPAITQDEQWAHLLPWNLNPDEVYQAPYEELRFN